MSNSYLIQYFLNGKKYEGDIYIISDNSLKKGFACFADPRYNFELDVVKIPIIQEKKERKKESNIDKNVMDIFSYI
jgi:hypothetical protein